MQNVKNGVYLRPSPERLHGFLYTKKTPQALKTKDLQAKYIIIPKEGRDKMDGLTEWLSDFVRNVLSAYVALLLQYYFDRRKKAKKKSSKCKKRRHKR